jgi:type IV secretion system protein VirD4
VGGLWVSTQWAAAMLGHQPRRGAPWATVLGQPIHHPWRLFEWWFAYEAYAPQVFRKAGMLAAGAGWPVLLSRSRALCGGRGRQRQ